MKRAVLAAVGALALATAANAQMVSYLFTLEGLQEVPPNLSQGTGLGNVSINTLTNEFSGGEIRGQVVPTPGAIVLLSAAGVLLVTPRRTRNRSQVGQS